MNKSKLIKEAIADAKSLQAIALQNAKAALEEAFTPQLQSILSTKLQQEMDGDDLDDVEVEDEVALDEADLDMEDGAEDELDYAVEEEEQLEDEMADETDLEAEVSAEDEMEDEISEEEEIEDEGDEEDVDLELEAILKEMEDDTEEAEEDTLEEAEINEEDELEDDEADLELESILREIEGMDDEEEDAVEDAVEEGLAAENTALKEELEEAMQAIQKLSGTINEVKLLNAKLLFTHKLFKSGNINEGLKVKIIEQFDKAGTINEAKLVYETIKASVVKPTNKRKENINESKASRNGGSTAPKKSLIKEGNENPLKARFMTLANLKVK